MAKLKVTVSHDLCTGVGMCMQYAPGAFRLNEAGQSEFIPDGDWTLEEVRNAADSCPMMAIEVVEEDGRG